MDANDRWDQVSESETTRSSWREKRMNSLREVSTSTLLDGNTGAFIKALQVPRAIRFAIFASALVPLLIVNIVVGYASTLLYNAKSTLQLQQLTKKIEQNPTSENYANRGLFLLLRKDYASAIPDFEKAVSLSPAEFSLRSNLGTCFHETGKYSRAVQEYSEALRSAPNQAGLFKNRGRAYSMLGKNDLALTDLMRAVQILEEQQAKGSLRQNENALFATTLLSIGDVYFELKRLDESLAAYQRAVDVDPRNIYAYFNASDTLTDLGRILEASRLLDDGIRVFERMGNSRAVAAMRAKRTALLKKARENGKWTPQP